MNDGEPPPHELTGLRAALAARDPFLATFLLLPRVEMVELAARAGFSAVIVDLEHGPITVAVLPELAAAARAEGIHAIARLAGNTPEEIGKTLDTGVSGVMVPHVGSRQQAEEVVAAGRFPPAGDRSINPYTRGNGYDLGGAVTVSEVNARVGLIAMLEGADVVANFADICRVPDLDAIFIGPVDLAASLGLEGDSEHPDVIAAVRDALGRAVRAGRPAGAYAPTPAAGVRWSAAGASLVAVSADVAMILGAFRSAAATFEELRRRSVPAVGAAPVPRSET